MTTSDPRDVLTRIKARAEEATEGPWMPLERHGGAYYDLHTGDEDHPHAEVFGGNPNPDAEFIAHARTDVPRLTEALAEVLYELDSIESDLDRYVDDLSSALPTTPEPVIERGFAMIRAERAVVGRIRRAIEDMLNEEE